jgi:hypothetical protein
LIFFNLLGNIRITLANKENNDNNDDNENLKKVQFLQGQAFPNHDSQ